MIYTTEHGARIVYVLDTPIPVDEAEAFHRWLVFQWCERGLEVDTSCSDWTRLFRLPKVLRNNKPTWEEDYFQMAFQRDTVLEVSQLGRIDNPLAKNKGLVREFDLPKPHPEIDHELLRAISENGHNIQSPWLTKVKRRLKNRGCYPCLFEEQSLAHRGSRHNTMLKYVGEAVSLLFGIEDESGNRLTTPDHVYALFLGPVKQLEPDRNTPDWTNLLWTQVLYCWANEDAEDRQREKEKEQAERDILDKLGSIVDGMREWCIDPALMGSDYDAKAWASDHLIAVGPRGSYIMRPDGWFDSVVTQNHSMVPRIKQLGMNGVIQTRVPHGERMRWASAQELMNQYGTVVAEISGRPQIKGGYIEHIDKSHSNLRIRLYGRRTDIEPTYNGQCDEWIKRLFGERSEEAYNWIGHSLAFEEGPIAAISIQGAAGVGKKMLAYGLSECVDTQTLARGTDLVEKFQPGLLRSPFLLVDEGWPARSGGGKHPADMFRELVGGSKRPVNVKFKNPVETTNPVRIMFTANDLNVLRMLSQGRDLSPEDREALGIRLLHFDVSARAALWLRRNGGADGITRGWIAPDGGGKSEFTLAKHFLWAYHNKRGPRGSRFLVEGNSNSQVMFDMRTQSGTAPVVIECIIRMLEVTNRPWPGLVVEESRLYVTAAEIHQFWRDNMNASEGRLTVQGIGQVMRGLVARDTKVSIALESRKTMGRKRWHEVDCRLLQMIAENVGWTSTVLNSLVESQDKLGIFYKQEETIDERTEALLSVQDLPGGGDGGGEA